MSDRGKGVGGLTMQEEAIRLAVLKYLESPEFDQVHKRFDSYWKPAGASRPRTTLMSFLSVITTPFASPSMPRDEEERRGRKLEILRRAARSIPVLLYPVIVETDFARSPDGVGPAFYAGTIDPAARNSREVMNGVVSRVARAESRSVELTIDRNYQPHRWRKLPAEAAGGVDVYVFDVLLASAFLPKPEFEPAPLPFLVEPEVGGQVLAVPTKVVAESLRAAVGS